MDVKHFNEFLIDLQTKDFSEVIQQIKEQLSLRKDMSATDIEKITEFIKHEHYRENYRGPRKCC